MHLILASQSQGRKKLFTFLKIPFTVIPSRADEEKILGETPLGTLKLRAKTKGEDVAERIRNSACAKATTDKQELRIKNQKNSPAAYNLQHITHLILSADSGAILDDQLIGKPKDYNDAVRILTMLSGKTHQFVTAVYMTGISKTHSKNQTDHHTILNLKAGDPGSGKVWQVHEISYVTFRKLSKEDIRTYLSTTKEYTRYAGGYAISSTQNFIIKIEGSISNVIGLPLEKVIPLLKQTKSGFKSQKLIMNCC